MFLKDDMVCYLARDNSHKELDEGRRVRLSTVRFVETKSQTKKMSCVVTRQYDHCVSTCVVFVAESPPFGPRRTFLEAMVMANNAHKPCGRTSVRRPRWQYNGQARGDLERVVQGRC